MSTADRPNEQAHNELYDAGMSIRRKVMVCLPSCDLVFWNQLNTRETSMWMLNSRKYTATLTLFAMTLTTYVHVKGVSDFMKPMQQVWYVISAKKSILFSLIIHIVNYWSISPQENQYFLSKLTNLLVRLLGAQFGLGQGSNPNNAAWSILLCLRSKGKRLRWAPSTTCTSHPLNSPLSACGPRSVSKNIFITRRRCPDFLLV